MTTPPATETRVPMQTPRLGKYRVVAHVARGPVADVLEARLDGIAGFSRLYALKRVHPEIAAQPEALARVEAEARRAAALAHGNLVQLLDLGRHEEHPYLVLEWVQGWSLDRILARAREQGTPLPVPHAAWIGLQVLEALDFAHHHRSVRDGAEVPDPVVHGGLGPRDVLISDAGAVKVSDFGLARAAVELARTFPDLVPARERLSPEQRAGGEPGPTSDAWAAAAIVVEALTLAEPTPGFPRADVPEPLGSALAAALSDDPAARPTVRALADAAVETLHGRGFTQETLAGWLRALFGLPPAPPLEPASPVGDADDLLGDPEDDEDDVGLPLSLTDLPDRDDVTEPSIAGGPLLDDDARTQAVAAPLAASPPAAPWDEPGPLAVPPAVEAQAAAVVAGAPAEEPVPAGAVGGRSWLVGVLVGALAMAVGAGLGVLGTLAWGGASVAAHAPVLEVHGGPDVTVHVDGQAVRGAATLEAGSHTLRVVVPGAEPVEVELALQPGEHRLLVIETVAPPSRTAAAEAAADQGAPR